MQIQATWPIGQFLTTITATVNDDRVADALSLALKHEGQRFTGIDKLFGGFIKDAAGKEKRDPDYKRGRVEYSEELALELSESLTKHLLTPDKDENGKDVAPLFSTVEIALPTKYEGGGVEPKYKKAKDALALYLAANGGKLSTGEPRTIASFCATRGVALPEDAEKWAEDTTFLAAVQAWCVEQEKKTASAD